ncbi:hypothetical protein FA95DRAFT_1561135 [Auriscalpium vulgare]|uniref:Uncharacterized protein n=1 Tax=Auriscalpium vulgare TaxID=40419 RepID=A0ACB8RMS5_9AGAM|nr:hypothetical protein FA95DRAFT_1561135 [Auriscalpium vulgare]
MYNSLGQTPCAVEAAILAQCDTGCVCNIPMYSLASACSACEQDAWSSWADWFTTHNCTSQQLDSSHIIVPNTTRVPHWAFSDVHDAWNASEAQSAGGLPESTVIVSTTVLPSLPSTPAHSDMPHPNVSSTGTKAAIAMGTLGVVSAFTLLGFLLVRAHRRASTKRFGDLVQSRLFEVPGNTVARESVRMGEGPFQRQYEQAIARAKLAA